MRVSAPNNANIMARAVRIPNNIVGIKLDRVRMENPKTIVTVVSVSYTHLTLPTKRIV